MLSMTGIEEIVKYQKELLNHQRNQKLIQKETIKLLNALNKNITFMSDRLDEFAQRTNIKLEMNDNISPHNSSSSQNHPINVNTIQELSNVNSNDEFFNSAFYDTNSNQHHHSLNIGGTVMPVASHHQQQSNTHLPINLNNEDIKEYYILSDCNLEPLSVGQSHSTGPYQIVQNNNNNNQQQIQQQVLMSPPPLNLNNNNNKVNSSNKANQNNNNTNNKSTGTGLLSAKIKSSSSRLSSSRSSRSNKLLDTTNTTGANTTATSEESLDDDLSMEEEESEDEKETIQVRKKPKVSYTVTTTPQSHSSKTKEYEESHNQQRLFNKYVRENVENRLGKEFLLLHEIQEIDHDVMESIKKDALEMYPPINIRPRRAWHLAKASLRCRRRSLRRQKEKQILLNPLFDANNIPPFNCTTTTTNLQASSQSQDNTLLSNNVQTMITMAHI